MEQLLHALAEAQQAGDAECMAIYAGGIARLLDMDYETQCAWCLSENGQEMGGGSHGICPRHAALLTEQSRIRRAARLAHVA